MTETWIRIILSNHLKWHFETKLFSVSLLSKIINELIIIDKNFNSITKFLPSKCCALSHHSAVLAPTSWRGGITTQPSVLARPSNTEAAVEMKTTSIHKNRAWNTVQPQQTMPELIGRSGIRPSLGSWKRNERCQSVLFLGTLRSVDRGIVFDDVCFSD